MRPHRPRLALGLLLASATACSSSNTSRAAEQDAGIIAPAKGEPTVPERTACTGLTAGPGTHDWTVEHDGRTRHYRVHVPAGYDATRPTAAVLAFHGFGSNELEMEGLTGLSTLADAEGFLAVYPRGLSASDISGRGSDGTSRGWNAGGCCGPSRSAKVDDVGFVDAVLADLDTRVCVDTRRTFATGFSNGGFFSYRLACERASRFAAVAPVAGMEGVSTCTPSRPVPVLHIHGTGDSVIRYDGGDNLGLFGGAYPSAEASVRRWAERNGCVGPTVETYQQGDSACTAATDCTPRTATASLCTVQGGLHAWPGFTDFNQGTPHLDATREAWMFFKARPRP